MESELEWGHLEAGSLSRKLSQWGWPGLGDAGRGEEDGAENTSSGFPGVFNLWRVRLTLLWFTHQSERWGSDPPKWSPSLAFPSPLYIPAEGCVMREAE